MAWSKEGVKILAINQIEVFYHKVIHVLKGVSLEVGQGQIISLLGANGAGKSTTLKAISGLLKSQSGEVTDGEIVFLDEKIHNELAPLIIEDIFKTIARINEQNKTAILLVEQNALAALEIASYCYVMENGRVVMDGPAEKLRDNEDIKEFYLGLSNVGSRKSYKEVKHYKGRKRWLS